jgi:hypothetical protein
VEKKFVGTWHVGTIIGVDMNIDTNDTIWEVRYDDGDTEDCDYRELDKIICPDLHHIL